MVIHTYPGALVSLYAHIGIEKGFYKKHGLDASTIDVATGPEANAGLAGGSLNFVLNTSDNLILAEDRGLDVTAVVGNANSNFYSLVGRTESDADFSKPYPEVMEELEGRNIGVIGRGTNGERFTKALFSDAGMDPESANYIAVGGPAPALAAFSSGDIDAYFAFEPFQTISTITGEGTMLLDCRVETCPPALANPGTALQTYYTSAEFAENNPEVVESFVAAHQEIDEWVHDDDNFDELTELAEKLYPPPSESDIDPSEFISAMLAASLPAFGVTIDPQGIEAWNEQLLEVGEIQEAVPVSAVLWDGAPRP